MSTLTSGLSRGIERLELPPSEAAGPEPGPNGAVGSGWIADVTVLASAQDQRNASMTNDAAGTPYVALEDWYPAYNHWRILVYRSLTGGTTWSYYTGAQSSAYDLLRPSIAATRTNGDIMVAYEKANGGNGIGVFKLIAGAWSAANVDPTTGTHDPRLAFDTSLTPFAFAFLVYDLDGGALNGTDIMFTRSGNSPFDSWDLPFALVGGAPGDASVNRNPSLSYGTGGYVYVAYERGLTGSRDIRVVWNSVFGDKFPTDYWTPEPGILVSGADDDFDGSISATHNGFDVIVAWTRVTGGTTEDIWTSYSADWGSTWSAERCLACGASINEEGAVFAADQGFGNFRIAYRAPPNAVNYREAPYNSPAAWSAAETVIDASGNASATYPDVAVSSYCNGAAYCYPAVVWTDVRGANSGIRYSTRIGRIDVGPTPLTIAEGMTQLLTAVVYVGTDASAGWEAPNNAVAWSVTGGVGSVSPPTGASTIFTAGPCAGGSSGTVLATNGVNRPVPVTVTSSSTPSFITIFPPSASVPEGGSRNFNTTVRDACNRDITSSASITWSATGGIGTLSPGTGPSTTFTAFLSAGGLTGAIVATSGSATGSAPTTVTHSGPINVTVSPSVASILEGGTVALAAVVKDVGGHDVTNQSVITWSVLPSCGGTNPSSGPNTTFTAATTAGGQTCVVSAAVAFQSWTDGGSSQVAVSHMGPIAVAVNPSSMSVPEGGTQTFSAGVTDAYGHDVTALSAITWSVPPSCGTVSPAMGATTTLTAATSAGGQTCDVRAAATFSTWANSGTSSVLVAHAGPITVVVTPPSTTLMQGDTASFSSTVTDVASHNVTSVTVVTWSVSPPACGAFSPATGATTVFTAAASAGGQRCTITATATFSSWTNSGTASAVVTRPDFDIAVAPSSRTVTAGASATYAVTLSPLRGFNSAVALSATGLPSGMTATFTPSAVTPPGSSTLTLTTAPSTAPGTYVVSLTGASASLSHSQNATLVVEPPPPDFSIAADPGTQSAVPGGSVTYTVTVTAINGFAGTVTMAVTGLPAGAAASFTPASVNPTGSSTLRIEISTAVALGTYSLTVTGMGGGVTHQQTLVLKVSESTAQTPSPGIWLWVALLIVVVVALVPAIILLRRKRKRSRITRGTTNDKGPRSR